VKKVMLLSGTASAINYIKSFESDSDICLHVTDSNPYCPGLYAPGVTPHVLPRARDTLRYREALDRLLMRCAIDVLIPTSDYDVEGVLDYLRDGWSPNVALFRPPYEAFRVLGHKGRLMVHLADLLPNIIPRTWTVDESSSNLTFPLVIKPTTESGGKGVIIINEPIDLRPGLERIRASYGGGLLLQEYIPGNTYMVSMVYGHDGALVIAVAMRSHLTFFTWGGAGCAGEIVDEAELVQLCSDVTAAAGGWRGPICLEWRRHARTGAFYLMEANCRLNGYSYLTTMNGVCLPRIVLALLTHEALPAVSPVADRNRNFILGFRETVIDQWVHPPGGIS